MSEINYRRQWAEGEIEAGTLLDAIDALAQRCRELETERDDLVGMVRTARLERDTRARACLDATNERDTLRAEVDDLTAALHESERRADNAGRNATAFEDRMGDLQVEGGKLRDEIADLKARLLEAERGNEELVRLRAEKRELIDRLKNIVTNPCESKEALAFRVGHLLEHAACATTDGATATP